MDVTGTQTLVLHIQYVVIKVLKLPDGVRGNVKGSQIHPEGHMNLCTQCRYNPSHVNSCSDIFTKNQSQRHQKKNKITTKTNLPGTMKVCTKL